MSAPKTARGGRRKGDAALQAIAQGRDPKEIIADVESVQKLMAMGYGDPYALMNAIWDMYYRTSSQNLHEMTEREINETLDRLDPRNFLTRWVSDDASYKPLVEFMIISQPEMRNATLNQAYLNFKTYAKEQAVKGNKINVLPFQEWVNTPLTMFRGERGRGESYEDYNVFKSYSYDKGVARDFANKVKGGRVYSVTIKPINTLGAPSDWGEWEVMIPSRKDRYGKGKSK